MSDTRQRDTVLVPLQDCSSCPKAVYYAATRNFAGIYVCSVSDGRWSLGVGIPAWCPYRKSQEVAR